MARRLMRNTEDGVLAGVAAGFADYFAVDPTLVRLGFVLLAVFGGSGLVLYLVSWLLMPRAGDGTGTAADEASPAERMARDAVARGEKVAEGLHRSSEGPGRGRLVAGVILVVVGVVFLLERFWPFRWWWIADLWPAALILVGLAMILNARRRGDDGGD
jgi:phage shock protein C